MSRSLRRVVAATIGLATFFGLWELLVRVGDVPSFYLRPPTEFFRFLFTSEVDFFSATLQTATKALAGLLVALVIGFTFGAMMSASRWFDEAAQPVLVFLQITPWIAYISAVVGWLGGGYPPALFMSTLVCLPVFAFASAQGLSAADPATVEVMHSVEATRWQIIRHLRLPNALPALFTAARLATGLSIAAVYFTEGGASTKSGLGRIGNSAIGAPNANALWATVMCAAAIGVVALLALGLLERVLLRWHVSQRVRPN